MRNYSTVLLLAISSLAAEDSIEKLRDRQDRTGLDARASALHAEAEKVQKDADKWYRSALAHSYVAEVAYELRDKGGSERAAEAGDKLLPLSLSLPSSSSSQNSYAPADLHLRCNWTGTF